MLCSPIIERLLTHRPPSAMIAICSMMFADYILHLERRQTDALERRLTRFRGQRRERQQALQGKAIKKQ